MPSDDELCELKESFMHLTAKMLGARAQGHMRLADALHGKVETTLDLSLIVMHAREATAA